MASTMDADDLLQPAHTGEHCNASPYARIVPLLFNNNETLHVHEYALSKLPRLSSNAVPGSNPIRLDLSVGAGHILVHFLYNGRLESLAPDVSPKGQCGTHDLERPTDSASVGNATAMLDSVLQIIPFAEAHGVEELSALAKTHISEMTKLMPYHVALDAVMGRFRGRNVYRMKWLQDYLREKAEIHRSSNSSSKQYALRKPR
ncbi:hypothetical protein Micbo1qcDRAFT_207022 [Microdochium bolleyi]|uniref:BTB domain-containing protein n=1 Tax=Microdochium bolleyi TaxID=196109 RepID=A0A136IV17_9PEZI|nr:hypothetical protein Micbo1qcDRAFT_207022 [Microdochium bolleyi]